MRSITWVKACKKVFKSVFGRFLRFGLYSPFTSLLNKFSTSIFSIFQPVNVGLYTLCTGIIKITILNKLKD